MMMTSGVPNSSARNTLRSETSGSCSSGAPSFPPKVPPMVAISVPIAYRLPEIPIQQYLKTQLMTTV